MSESKKRNVFWPAVGTVDEAKKAASYGMGSAIVVAVFTAGFATWAVVSRSTVLRFVDAWAYLDAVLFSLVAWGIHKESRVAAVVGLALYLLEKAYQIQTTGTFQGAVMAVFLTLFFVSGVRGTFALRRLRNIGGQQGAPGDDPRPESSARP